MTNPPESTPSIQSAHEAALSVLEACRQQEKKWGAVSPNAWAALRRSIDRLAGAVLGPGSVDQLSLARQMGLESAYEAIDEALTITDGNVAEASNVLGIGIRTFRRWVAEDPRVGKLVRAARGRKWKPRGFASQTTG